MSTQPHAATAVTPPPRRGPTALERHVVRLASDHAGLMVPNLDAAGFDDALVTMRPEIRRTLGKRDVPAFLASLERKAATVPDAGGCRLSFAVVHGEPDAVAGALAGGRTRDMVAASYAKHCADRGAEASVLPMALAPGQAVALGPGGIRSVVRAAASADAGRIGRALPHAAPMPRNGVAPGLDADAGSYVVVLATRGAGDGPVPPGGAARFLTDAAHALAPTGVTLTHVGDTLSGAVSAMSREMLALTLLDMREEVGIPVDERPEAVHVRVDADKVVVVAEHEGYTLEPVHVPMALVSRDLGAFACDLADLAVGGRMVTYAEGEDMPEPGDHAPAPGW